MFSVQFTGTRSTVGSDGDATVGETGWIDPSWSMFALYEEAEDVPVYEFETHAEALEKITDTIGWVEGGERGTYYATDSNEDYRTGDVVMLAGHITEV